MKLHPALWFEAGENQKVLCLLCPHKCMLNEGQIGICRVRQNYEGKLNTLIYGQLSSLHLDPVEKKPLYHFFPGKSVLSVGSVGCNLRCTFCQNCEISQVEVQDSTFLKEYSPVAIASISGLSVNNIGVAFTYNEPAIWYEFIQDVSLILKSRGMKTIMVTNGFINPEPLIGFTGFIDAFSVDLKGFTEQFYKKILHGSLAPVLQSLEIIRKAGRHLEVVNLVIPGLNDDPIHFESMTQWIADHLGKETILHLSAYYPKYLSEEPPTPSSTLIKFRDIALKYLDFVYVGNLPNELNNTYCPDCRQLLISRLGYKVLKHGINEFGSCLNCGKLAFQNF